MVARQRSQWQVGQRARVDPHHLIDFSARSDRPFHIDGIYSRAHPAILLVRRSTFEYPKRSRAALGDAAAQLLGHFTCERCNIAFAGIAFSARLHESRRTALADPQHAATPAE